MEKTRKCKKCGAILSIYNNGDQCWAHTARSEDIHPKPNYLTGNIFGQDASATQLKYDGYIV